MEVLEFIGWFLSASWDFFTETKVPGFDFSFAALFIGIALATLGLKLLFMMIGLSAPFGSVTSIARNTKEKGDKK